MLITVPCSEHKLETISGNDEGELPKKYERQLHLQLQGESDTITDRFAFLMIDVESCLIENNVPVDRLISCISPSRNDTLVLVANNIDKAKNISEVFIQLKRNGPLSFLNYKMISRIIHLCNNNELSKKLENYEAHFKEYIKRRVCETSFYMRCEFKPGEEIAPEEGAELVIITDDSWSPDYPFVKIDQLRQVVANIFNISDFALDLKRVKSNCLRLFYYISSAVGRFIFPLSDQQEDKLSYWGIKEIHYENFHYLIVSSKKIIFCR